MKCDRSLGNVGIDDATNAGVAQLVAMGFSDAQARDALSKTGGSVQAATELLLG